MLTYGSFDVARQMPLQYHQDTKTEQVGAANYSFGFTYLDIWCFCNLSGQLCFGH